MCCQQPSNVLRSREIRWRRKPTPRIKFEVPVPSIMRPIEIGFDPQPLAIELPIVSAFKSSETAGDAKGCRRRAGATKYAAASGDLHIHIVGRKRHSRVFPPVTAVCPHVEPGPAIDGRGYGRWWRSLDRHVSRKSGRSDQCGDGNNGEQLLHEAPENMPNLPYGLPGGCYRLSTVKGKIASQALPRTCLHGISPKGLPRGETIQGEWGLRVPEAVQRGRPPVWPVRANLFPATTFGRSSKGWPKSSWKIKGSVQTS